MYDFEDKEAQEETASLMADWYRIDFPEALQGHALASKWGSSEFIAWEDSDGWRVKRVDTNGYETSTAKAEDFAEIRKGVETAKAELEANPAVAAQPTNIRQVGTGALIGTLTGMVIGGLPGVLTKHGPLTTVGVAVGAVAGAATGAVVADRLRERNAGPNAALKKKLLR